jgi:O-antigen/teichoic acid export membrane protein
MVDGTARILLAEALFPLTVLITMGFLTRHLGPQGYGLLALTLTTVLWIENGIMSFFTNATIKFVGESHDWRPIGGTILRLSMLSGCIAMVAVWLVATPFGALLQEPDLAFYLRVAALDIPISCIGQTYRNILIGTAHYRGGALARAGRWLTRLCLVVLLVEAGLSVTGALCGVIGSSIAELTITRWYLRGTSITSHMNAAIPIHRYGAMLFISSLCLTTYNGIDLLMLKALGGTASQAGIYGAAQSLSYLPSLFAWIFSSLLLATLSRLLADHAEERARELARDAMRVTLWLLPVAAMISGAASEIVEAVFGQAFVSAAPLLSLLVIAAVANVLLALSLTIMTADGRPARTVSFSLPLVLVALGGHLLLIPRLGQQGAAIVTLSVSLLGASAAVAEIYRLWHVCPPAGTLLRSLLVALIVGAGSALCPTDGWLVFVKLMAFGLIALFGYWWIGEFRHNEIAVFHSYFFPNKELKQSGEPLAPRPAASASIE